MSTKTSTSFDLAIVRSRWDYAFAIVSVLAMFGGCVACRVEDVASVRERESTKRACIRAHGEMRGGTCTFRGER